ncbi:MAG: alpha/beta fold hydrolase [Silvibacterium sp.]|nr:alpha/beta fold hydrolase [Silvibacterium sp.]
MAVIASDHWITTDRGKLFAKRWVPSNPRLDTGPTILLFHDSLGCVDLWRDFPQELAVATRRPVVAYDRLGFGRSDAHPDPLPLTFIRDEGVTVVPRLCKSLGIETLVPFGHSVGGAMAITAAARLSESCIAVVTESAQSFVDDGIRSGIRAAQANFERPGQFERLARYHGQKAHWVLRAWIDTWLAPDFAGWCLDDDLRSVRCPILALHGDGDEYGSWQHAERIVSLAQGASQAVMLKGCGHVPHREQPARVLGEVTQFLARQGCKT